MGEPVDERADDLIANLRSRRRPNVFVISGPSGVGKDTVIDPLRTRFADMHFAVTATTRARRPGEIDGVHYYFLDDATFTNRLEQGEFLESATVYGFRYGVPKWGVREALARGQDVVIKIDVQGAATIRSILSNATFIFLAPESLTTLLQRLRSRKTDDPDALMLRFATASREISSVGLFDYVIFNEDEKLEGTIDEITAVIVAQRCRTEQPVVDL